MNNTGIHWYSISTELAVEEHEPIGLADALKIVDRYLVRGSEKFSGAKETIAAAMFGFSRSRSEFIEICVNGPDQISYKFEMSAPNASWFGRMFKSAFRHEEELHSRRELVRKVEEFFNMPVKEIKRHLKSR